MNYFEELAKVDCSSHVEKKGKFSYLSWPFAVSELKRKHPKATWEVIKFEGAPYCKTEAGCFVEVCVDVDGVKLSQIHPVLDSRNQTVLKPNAFQVNTSIQRCLVKAIALHGLGLNIYAGEDLPMGVEEGGYVASQPEKSLEKPVFSTEEFDGLKEQLLNAINAGDRTVDQIITNLETNFILGDDIKEKIRGLK